MGTHATTRISSGNDYIELNTRWDGFYSEIMKNVDDTIINWRSSLELLNQRIKNHPHPTPELLSWLENLEKLIDDYEKNKTIESLSILLAARSFVHHQVLPHSIGEFDLISDWGKDNPDLTFNIENGLVDVTVHQDYNDYIDDKEVELMGSPIKEINVSPKPINSEYKVARIYNMTSDNSYSESYYVDVKFKDLTEVEFAKKIMQLPQFWRDLYEVTKTVHDKSPEFYSKMNLPIFKLSKKLGLFYTPIPKYSRSYRIIRNDNFTKRTLKDKKKIREELIQEISDDNTFDFSIEAMTTHLFIAFPNQVFPITEAERMVDYEIDFVIGVMDRVPTRLYINIPSMDYNSHKTLFEESFLNVKEREKIFNELNDVEYCLSDSSYKLKQMKDSDPYIIMFYEKNIMAFMESQYDKELLELNE